MIPRSQNDRPGTKPFSLAVEPTLLVVRRETKQKGEGKWVKSKVKSCQRTTTYNVQSGPCGLFGPRRIYVSLQNPDEWSSVDPCDLCLTRGTVGSYLGRSKFSCVWCLSSCFSKWTLPFSYLSIIFYCRFKSVSKWTKIFEYKGRFSCKKIFF